LIAHSLHVFSAPVHVPCDALLAIFACENEQLSRENNRFCRKIVLMPQQRFPALNSVSKTRRAMKPAAIPKPATNMIVPPVGSLFNPLNVLATTDRGFQTRSRCHLFPEQILQCAFQRKFIRS
jgi:hypothetical protein